VWKLLFDPSRFPEWWVGIETVRVDTDREYTVWPEARSPGPSPVLTEKRPLLAASVVALAALAEREHGLVRRSSGLGW
jgi:hypothetical protein